MATVLGLSHQTSLGTAAEELEGGDHAFEDRLGALEGQRQNEGIIRVGPGGNQERDKPAAVGEIDVDMAEIGFEALARKMPQRDEGLPFSASVLEQIALHLGVAAAVVVFVAKATEHLRGGVTLLGRRGLVVDKDLVDDPLEGTEFWCGAIPSRLGVGSGCFRTFRMVFRECLNSRAICRMDLPSRCALRMAP